MSVTLKHEVDKFFDFDLGLAKEQTECLKVELGRFCLSGKKEDAFSVYYCYSDIFRIFGKDNTLQQLTKLLSDHEYHSGELLQKHRDHYSHSVYVFSLGLALYANDKTYREYIQGCYPSFTHHDFLHYWGLVGLFHDIGYPFQLAHEQIKDYMKELFPEGEKPHVSFDDMERLLKLSQNWMLDAGYDAKDLNELFALAIDKRMPYLGYEKVLAKLNLRASDPNFMDHAYFSALLLSSKLQEANVQLNELLLDSLTAILLHNSIIRHYLAREDKSIPATRMEVHPLAYLLMLCDEIQCWDREAFGLNSKKKPIAWDFAIGFEEGVISLNYTFDTFIIGQKEDGRPIYENDNANKAIARADEDGLLKDIRKAVSPHLAINISVTIKPKKKNTHSYASSTLLLNLEEIAFATHASYMDNFRSFPNVARDFDELSLFYKLDNIDQAKSYAYKLELINCMYSEKELDYPIIRQFDEKAAAFLAAQEHVRWVQNRLRYGWSYGRFGVDYTIRNRDAKKKHQSIVPYGILSEEEKKKDLITVNNMIKFLYEECRGIKIYAFRNDWKPVLKIFGSGHRNIDIGSEEELKEIKKQIADILREYQKTNRVVVKTNFSYGSDLIIAEVALSLGISIDAYLPMPYEQMVEDMKNNAPALGYPFDEAEERKWRNIIAQTTFYNVIEEKVDNPFEEALKRCVNQCDAMIALWDGVETKLTDIKGKPINRGGTYHGILIGRERGMEVHTIPCRRIVK